MPDTTTDLIAGYWAGVASIAIGNPLDIIKVRLQAAVAPPEPIASSISQHPAQSLGKLLAGTAAPLISYGALNGILFASYSYALKQLQYYFPSSSCTSALICNGDLHVFVAGFISGACSCVISTPAELIKCQVQTETSQSGHRSSWTTTRAIYRSYGILGFYKGTAVTALRDSFGYGVYFISYSFFKRSLAESFNLDPNSSLIVLLAGGLAGCFSWASIFPLDSIKTRYQTDATNAYSSTLACARTMYNSQGPCVFFHGFIPTMTRAFIVNAVQFAVYEQVVNFLEPS
ncbi:mitochondrial carrier domain-containing protein [Dipodascopsis uninucleata]